MSPLVPSWRWCRCGRTRSRWTGGRRPCRSCRRRCSHPAPGCRRWCPSWRWCRCGCTRSRGGPEDGHVGGAVAVVVTRDRDVAAGPPAGARAVADVPGPVGRAEDGHVGRAVAVVVTDRERGAVDVGHGQADRDGVRVEAAVVGLVGEAVGTLVGAGRGVREAAVGGEAQGAVGGVGDLDRAERVAVGVRVIREKARGSDRQGRVLWCRVAVGDRNRGVVDAG